MVNGLGVVGWGVGGIEAEAAMLGQPSSMLIPPVVGYRLTGRLPEGATATDLVLTITEALRKKGVVGKFVEFYGPGLAHLTIADRVTLGNMCPEYGATVAIFPIDDMTLDYLRLTGRDAAQVALVEAYARAQGLFRTDATPDAVYSETLELDLSTVVPSLAGPRRPQDRVPLGKAKASFAVGAARSARRASRRSPRRPAADAAVADATTQLEHGSVVIAAITSCTNTSNPSVMIGAGLVAKKAVERGLTRKPWVKTSLAPGSKVVTEYLDEGRAAAVSRSARLQPRRLRLHDLHRQQRSAARRDRRRGARARPRRRSVLSGNRNFEGRIQQDVRANYLASPPLVVAYALAGSMNVDVTTEPLGDRAGRQAGLPEGHLADGAGDSADDARGRDRRDVPAAVREASSKATIAGSALPVPTGDRFAWEDDSTYIRRPPFLENMHARADAARGHHGRARAGGARRQHHHRSHLAGRIDQGRQPGRASI